MSFGSIACAVRCGTPSTACLSESAEIATSTGPRITEAALTLTVEYIDRSVLDPTSAGEALSALRDELRRVTPEVNALVQRQVVIARELRDRLSDLT